MTRYHTNRSTFLRRPGVRGPLLCSIAICSLLPLFSAGLAAQTLPEPIVPENEKPFLGVARERLPGAGWINFGDSGITFNTATSESVGDGTGMMIYTQVKNPGRIVAYDSAVVVNQQRNDFKEWTGLSFWYHGDGTDATGVIGWGENMQHRIRFPLDNTGWKKHFIPWDDFGKYFNQNTTQSNLAFAIELPDQANYVYTLDKVRMFSGEKPVETQHSSRIESPWPTRLVRPGGGFVLESSVLNEDETDGVQFWTVSNGTTAKGTLSWWGNTETKTLFSLENTTWEHKAFGWDELPPRPEHIPRERQRLIFSLKPPTRKGHWLVMDRLHLYKRPVIETVSPTVRADPPGYISTKQFIKRREKLEPFQQRLRNRESINMLAIGDSIISGENLIYLYNGNNYFYMSGFAGWMLTATGTRFGYKSKFLNVEIYNPRNGRWRQLTPPNAFRKGFYATVIGTEGLNSELTQLSLDRVDSYKPDLILLQPGVYDVFYSTPEIFEQKLDHFVKSLIDKKYTVVLGSQTPVINMEPSQLLNGDSYFNKGKAYATICEKIADQYELPFIDVRGALEARGTRAVGDNFQDTIHPNKRGHRIIGILYYSMISGEDRTIWQFVPKPNELASPY